MAIIDPKISRPTTQLIDLVAARTPAQNTAAATPDSKTVTRSFESLIHGGGSAIDQSAVPQFGGVFGYRNKID